MDVASGERLVGGLEEGLIDRPQRGIPGGGITKPSQALKVFMCVWNSLTTQHCLLAANADWKPTLFMQTVPVETEHTQPLNLHS